MHKTQLPGATLLACAAKAKFPRFGWVGLVVCLSAHRQHVCICVVRGVFVFVVWLFALVLFALALCAVM
eukprot:NODE_5639_length_566_cov_1.234834.p4 GENE.NODE_5639_length_566_cov_1.234834~~NODE_5639_length_566_cov_1.234834.p4  ORF type:complete len:69 (-),score=2.16 NODE_5639_length_566_cov_1.234834:7-213(-)